MERRLGAVGHDCKERAYDHGRDVVRRCVRAAMDSAVHDFLFAVRKHGENQGKAQVLFDGQSVAQLSEDPWPMASVAP